MLERDRTPGGRAGGVPLPFELRLKAIHYDYLVCQRWDATAEAYVGGAINVARAAITRRLEYDGKTLTDPVDGTSWTYDYTGVQERTVSGEEQVIVPRLIEDESSILIMPCQPITVRNDGDTADVICQYVELPQGRAFAKVPE
ncbi:MAG: hypothetical protein IT445_03035 [Phycisphaeraceae bacterium]|nr:hypothetical protein [Phycisphaeraceae bacterium]